jgi:ParB family chromosome partitioning protein
MGKKKVTAKGADLAAAAAHLAHIAPDLRPLALPLDMLTLDPKNARAHGAESIESIKASLRKFGQRKPVVFNLTSGYVLAGNGTVMAARELGYAFLAAVRVEDDPHTATGYAIADNRTAELSTWDDAALALAMAEIRPAEGQESDLYSTLLLAELETSTPPPPKPATVLTRFGVSVELATEADQTRLLARLKREGFKAKGTKYEVKAEEPEAQENDQ